MLVRREAAKEGGQASGAGFCARSQDDRVSGAEGVGGLGDVVAQPADDGDVAVVADQRRGPARLVGQVGGDAVGSAEVALDGRGETRHDDRDMGGPVHIAHGNRHSGGAAGDVEGEQLAGSAVALVEYLPGGSDGGQLGDRLLVREPPGSAAEGPDGDGAVETAGAVEEVAPGPGSRFERGDLGDEGGRPRGRAGSGSRGRGPSPADRRSARRSRGDGGRRTPAAPPRGRPTRRRGRHQVAVTGRR